jgi:hypothetical protein
MYVKVYWMIWAVALAAAGLFFVTGNLTTMVGIWFGFLAFGLVFMGMISVLPSMVHDQVAAARPAREPRVKLDSVVAGTSEAIRKIGADIAASSTVEMHKPRFH